MTIAFRQVPVTNVPGVYQEVDPTLADAQARIQTYKTLMFAQKTSGGNQTADTLRLISTEEDAIEAGGRGSMLHLMAKTYFATDRITELWVAALADHASGVAAQGTITVTGPATASGTIYLYIDGQYVPVGVASGDAQNDIATAIGAEISAALDLPVTASVSTNVVTLTARNDGEVGNSIGIEVNYFEGERLPAGVGIAISAMASGATNPTLTNAIAALGDEQYHVMVLPYSDSASIAAVKAELERRWQPEVDARGIAIGAYPNTHSNIVTFGGNRNSELFSFLGYRNIEDASKVAAGVAAVVARFAPTLPRGLSRSFGGRRLAGLLAPKKSVRFTYTERNQQLTNGMSTHRVTDGGDWVIERLRTTRQTTDLGAPTDSWKEINTPLQLVYLTWSFAQRFLSKFPQASVGDDGSNADVTPGIVKSEMIALYDAWVDLGITDGSKAARDLFKGTLLVERHAGDPTRIDVQSTVTLVSPFYNVSHKLQFVFGS